MLTRSLFWTPVDKFLLVYINILKYLLALFCFIYNVKNNVCLRLVQEVNWTSKTNANECFILPARICDETAIILLSVLG